MIEIFTYHLGHQQKKIGSYIFKSHVQAKQCLAEASLELKDFGETAKIWQQSEADSTSFTSSYFQEINEGEGFTRHFQLRYDADEAMLYTTRKLNGEEEERSSYPSLLAYSDSLALLSLVRHMSQHKIEHRRVAMVGKDVVIERSPVTKAQAWDKLEPAIGLDKKYYRASWHHYRLYPGNAYILVSSLAPYPIVQLLQPSAQGMIEATLQYYRTRAGYLRDTNRKGGRQRPKRRRRRAKRRS